MRVLVTMETDLSGATSAEVLVARNYSPQVRVSGPPQAIGSLTWSPCGARDESEAAVSSFERKDDGI